MLAIIDLPIDDDFPYTGPLRPYHITPMRTVPDSIEKPDYSKHPEGISKCEEDVAHSKEIPVYNDHDIDEMRKAGKIGRLVLDTIHKAVAIGVTTDELDVICHETTIENDCYPSPLNYYKFPKSVCTSVNEVICHGIPDRRPLENGDILDVDVTIFHKGYHADLNETYLIGDCDKDSIHLVKSAYEALMKAIEICKPGAHYSDIGNLIGKYIEKQGLSVVKTYCGHGVCKLFHTTPNVPHYKNNKANGIMRPGHIFTIEPMINQGIYRDITWDDNWTAVTEDGKRSAQFEHTLLITEDGCEVLTARNESSPILEIFK